MPRLGKGEVLRIKQIRATISGLRQKGKKKILELGCGNGLLLEPLCSENECHGIDISDQALRKASERGYLTHKIDLEKADLPFQDGYFNVAVCAEVLEHVVNTEGLLNEVNRVLQKDATLIVSFPNASQPISFICMVLDITPMYSARLYSPHVRDLTLRLVKGVLEVKGFAVVHSCGTYVYPSTGRLSRLLASKFPRLGEKIILVAQKQNSGTLLPPVLWDVRDIINHQGKAIASCSSNEGFQSKAPMKTHTTHIVSPA